MIQKLSIFEPTYQEQKFQEKLDAFIVACKEIEHLWFIIGHTSPSPLDDLFHSLMAMAMFANKISTNTSNPSTMDAGAAKRTRRLQ